MLESQAHHLSEKKKLDIVRDAYKYCSVNRASIVHNVSIEKVKHLVTKYDKHGAGIFRFKKPKVDVEIAHECIIRFKLYGESASYLQKRFELPSQAYIYNWLKSYNDIVKCIDNFKTKEGFNMSNNKPSVKERLSAKYKGTKEEVRKQLRKDFTEIDKRLRIVEYLEASGQDYKGAAERFDLKESYVRNLWSKFQKERYRGIFPLQKLEDFEVLARYEQPTVELTWYDYEQIVKSALFEIELQKKLNKQK